jgi:putative oxidoreductase
MGNSMNSVLKLEDWADQHHPGWLDFLRIFLGLFLIIKGVSLVNNSDLIVASILNDKVQFLAFAAAEYSLVVLLVGGLLITLGLITRVVIIFELPILIVEVFFVKLQHVFSIVNYRLNYSIIILLLLLFFLFYGSGPFSADNLLIRTRDKFE